jgi:type IV secretory pathway VirB6-like protein
MRYVLLSITVLEAAIYFVIGFGYIAAAIAVLLGPVFIPFFIVPGMEWLFWGWLKALLQYAFYPVVANAYLFVVGSLLVHFVDSHPPPFDGANIPAMFAPLLILLIAITWGVLKVPSLVNSLFTGKAGESAVPSLN